MQFFFTFFLNEFKSQNCEFFNISIYNCLFFITLHCPSQQSTIIYFIFSLSHSLTLESHRVLNILWKEISFYFISIHYYLLMDCCQISLFFINFFLFCMRNSILMSFRKKIILKRFPFIFTFFSLLTTWPETELK